MLIDPMRRIRLDMFTPAEKAIWDAAKAVEAAGCDVRLTHALNKLSEARALVADVVDGAPFASVDERICPDCNKPLIYAGKGRWRCDTYECPVIEQTGPVPMKSDEAQREVVINADTLYMLLSRMRPAINESNAEMEIQRQRLVLRTALEKLAPWINEPDKRASWPGVRAIPRRSEAQCTGTLVHSEFDICPVHEK